MDWDKEELSLRVMRLLFQLNQQDGEAGLDFDTLLNRAGFTNINNEKPLLEKSLIELEDRALIYKHKKEYYISKMGVKWYGQFKYKLFQDYDKEMKGGVHIFNNSNSTFNAVGLSNKDSHNHFPGNTSEFIPHYKKLLSFVKSLREQLLDLPVSNHTMETLDELEILIEQNSNTFGNGESKE